MSTFVLIDISIELVNNLSKKELFEFSIFKVTFPLLYFSGLSTIYTNCQIELDQNTFRKPFLSK